MERFTQKSTDKAKIQCRRKGKNLYWPISIPINFFCQHWINEIQSIFIRYFHVVFISEQGVSPVDCDLATYSLGFTMDILCWTASNAVNSLWLKNILVSEEQYGQS